MESAIDERFRHILLEYYLDNPKEQFLYRGSSKWVFVCPFCGSQGKTEAKKKHRKAALLWIPKQHSWIFCCAKKGSVECMNNKTLGNLLCDLNPALGQAYKQERWHRGTTGKGHNCGAPRWVVGISTGAYGSMSSRRFP